MKAIATRTLAATDKRHGSASYMRDAKKGSYFLSLDDVLISLPLKQVTFSVNYIDFRWQ